MRRISLIASAVLAFGMAQSADAREVAAYEASDTCEIIICVRRGFPSSAGCRPARREFIKRIFKRKPPIPIPPECPLTWFHPLDPGLPLPPFHPTDFGASFSKAANVSPALPDVTYAKSPANQSDMNDDYLDEDVGLDPTALSTFNTSCSPSRLQGSSDYSCTLYDDDEMRMTYIRDRTSRWRGKITYKVIVDEKTAPAAQEVTTIKTRYGFMQSYNVTRNGGTILAGGNLFPDEVPGVPGPTEVYEQPKADDKTETPPSSVFVFD